jgi:hypothetical protein
MPAYPFYWHHDSYKISTLAWIFQELAAINFC